MTDLMERHGVRPDHFTISILMKLVKRSRSSWHASRVFEFLDRSGIDVCSDEILLNSIMEACIRYHEHGRLKRVLASFAASPLLPAVPTYGTLIKAAGVLQNMGQCWEYWRRIEQRGLVPNDVVLGCMLDALVGSR